MQKKKKIEETLWYPPKSHSNALRNEDAKLGGLRQSPVVTSFPEPGRILLNSVIHTVHRESRISWNCPSFKLLKFVTKDAAALCSNSLFPFMSPAIWMAKRPRQSKEVDTFCACQAEQLSACANQRTLPETLRARLLCEQNGLRHGICKTVGHFQFIFVMITTAQNKLWKSAFAWRRSKHSLRGYDTVCRVHCKCACITTQR